MISVTPRRDSGGFWKALRLARMSQHPSEIEVDIDALEMTELRVLSALQTGQNPGAVSSVLKLVEQKWNLPPLTARDAAAATPLSALDLDGPPAFREPPSLPKPSLAWGSW